jgi:membrane fusion protein, macrolide-specific efflux system
VFEVPNEERVLRIGMSAQVGIVLMESKNAITIPATALGKKEVAADKTPSKVVGQEGTTSEPVARYAVRVLLDSGTVETRSVRTGINNNIRVEVLEGIKEGEKVVTSDDAMDEPGKGGKSDRKSRLR